MWFLKPKNTVLSVANQILDGLKDGSVVLSASLASDPNKPTTGTVSANGSPTPVAGGNGTTECSPREETVVAKRF